MIFTPAMAVAIGAFLCRLVGAESAEINGRNLTQAMTHLKRSGLHEKAHLESILETYVPTGAFAIVWDQSTWHSSHELEIVLGIGNFEQHSYVISAHRYDVHTKQLTQFPEVDESLFQRKPNLVVLVDGVSEKVEFTTFWSTSKVYENALVHSTSDLLSLYRQQRDDTIADEETVEVEDFMNKLVTSSYYHALHLVLVYAAIVAKLSRLTKSKVIKAIVHPQSQPQPQPRPVTSEEHFSALSRSDRSLKNEEHEVMRLLEHYNRWIRADPKNNFVEFLEKISVDPDFNGRVQNQAHLGRLARTMLQAHHKVLGKAIERNREQFLKTRILVNNRLQRNAAVAKPTKHIYVYIFVLVMLLLPFLHYTPAHRGGRNTKRRRQQRRANKTRARK
jgi:hypothetical protein